jgi:hypothetical protein
MSHASAHTSARRLPTAAEETTIQIRRCADLHASVLAQRGRLRHECDLQARALVHTDARMSAAAHLPLVHHTAGARG